MSQFRRAIRLFLLILGVIVGLVTAVAAYMTRMLVTPPRQRLWANPADLGLPFEEVQFPARDGLRLSGWFIPATASEAEPAGTIVLVHGWPGNRLGSAAENVLTDLPGSEPLSLLPLALALHRRGYQLLMFDLRNHGQSAAAPPFTFGLREANDLLGAVDYLSGRKDVAEQNIGVIGFSAGANTLLYAVPRTDKIQAAIAVQPTSPHVFASRYGRYLLGPLSKIAIPITEWFYQFAGGMPFDAVEPIFSAAGAGMTPVLFVQGTGDPWGSVDNVAQMAAATPRAEEPLLIDSSDRFGGYQYIIKHPEVVDAFFSKHMSTAAG
jgi:pimeloyl-ACP methyl ester carboxylesterase